ncbi:MAG: hypothetical protein ABR949_01995 [Candidatus Aquilonibacter sp.]|jgi:hypothetical protein
MSEPSIFKAWENFYVITGSSSAALTGLVFIVVTLSTDLRRRVGSTQSAEGTSIFSSPTVVHFCAAFFNSVVYAAPWRVPAFAGMLIALAGLFGAAYAFNTGRRARRLDNYSADASDWIWFIILPFVTYLVLCVGGFCLPRFPENASYAIAAGTVMLVFIGIHNAWDVVIYLATRSDDA